MQVRRIATATATLLALAVPVLPGAAAPAAQPGSASAAHDASGLPAGHPRMQLRSAKVPPARLVDLNSASIAELKTLPGIGDAEAKRIVAARPYPSKAKLVASKVLTDQQFAQLKGLVEARQKLPKAGKPAAKT